MADPLPGFPAPLAGCEAKLKRAAEHLEALEHEVISYVEGDAYALILKHKVDPATYAYEVSVRQPPPLRWGCLLGDGIHNLRSALDHLVCALLRLVEPSSDCSTTQFPICDSETRRGGWEVKSRQQLTNLLDAHREVIKEYQPFHRGDNAKHHPLAALRWLSDLDKHRVLHPVLTYLEGADPPGINVRFQPNTPPGAGYQLVYRAGPIEDGKEVITIRLFPAEPEPEVEINGDLPIGVAFSERLFTPADIFQIGGAVNDVVSRCGREFF